MLVLSRKLGERILVPHCDLTVTVVAIHGKTVRLGITAPAEIGIHREELWQRVGPEREMCTPSARAAVEDPAPARWCPGVEQVTAGEVLVSARAGP